MTPEFIQLASGICLTALIACCAGGVALMWFASRSNRKGQ